MAIENNQIDDASVSEPPSVPYGIFETSVLLSATSLSDMRAFFILSASAGAFAVCLSALFGSAVKPPEVSQYLYWISAFFFLFSCGLAFYTVFFKTSSLNENISLHWDADGFKKPVDMFVASHVSLTDPALRIAQLRFLYEMARVCRKKHAGLRISMVSIPFGVIALIAAQIAR